MTNTTKSILPDMGSAHVHTAGHGDERITRAKNIIAAAERDLWPLSDGERRDLLCDNTGWTFEEIEASVEALKAFRRAS